MRHIGAISMCMCASLPWLCTCRRWNRHLHGRECYGGREQCRQLIWWRWLLHLRTQLSQFGITPEQMFEQMNLTLERMRAQLESES